MILLCCGNTKRELNTEREKLYENFLSMHGGGIELELGGFHVYFLRVSANL